MSMELADVPAGRRPGTESRTRDRSGAFALPVSTSFRFTLLIAAVAASSFFVYQGIYLAAPRGPALISLMLRCRNQALAPHPALPLVRVAMMPIPPPGSGIGANVQKLRPCSVTVRPAMIRAR